jgi:hypothetical protein
MNSANFSGSVSTQVGVNSSSEECLDKFKAHRLFWVHFWLASARRRTFPTNRDRLLLQVVS